MTRFIGTLCFKYAALVTFGLFLMLVSSALATHNDRHLDLYRTGQGSIIDDDLWPLDNELQAMNEDQGAKLYQQWCSTCHGDQGQGLTEEWRATWPESKQNCWQSKCHASNHPPDGFSFPQTVPALIGPNTLTKFNTAQDLYVYTRAAMPYWAPNMLLDDEYQAITAFLVEANYSAQGFAPSPSISQDLTTIPLHPATSTAEAEDIEDFSVLFSQGTPMIIILAILIALGWGGWLKYCSKTNRRLS